MEKDVVESDIRKYVETSLSEISSPACVDVENTSNLICQCGTLFIYAATAVRYIMGARGFPSNRLSAVANRSTPKGFQASLDDLYGQILEQACTDLEEDEINNMRNFASDIVFLQTPLPIHVIASLSETDIRPDDLRQYLSRLHSVVHIPDHEGGAVTLFHASFFDFITDPTRCTPERCRSFQVLAASEGHEQLALNCLACMKKTLKYNICDVPKAMTVSRMEATNSPDGIDKISEALKYSCVHWAAHLALVDSPSSSTNFFASLHYFLHTHLLHWIECLSVLGELSTGVPSLYNASTVLARFETTDDRYHKLRLLVDDARRCLQMNFGGIRKHCMEIYWSSLVWLPKQSLIRQVYSTYVNRVPTVTLGLPNTWGPTELVMHNHADVYSVAISRDGSRVVSGSDDATIRIWNAITGQMEAELEGHRGSVLSVAFSQDGGRIISGSEDRTVRIWNAVTGELEGELEGHMHQVTSVALSPDGSRVVSGSMDNIIRIWNAVTCNMECELRVAKLEGHEFAAVSSVAFSCDGSRIVSGSNDSIVRIWNAVVGEMEAVLEGHTAAVQSVAFSQNGSQVVSGSDDTTVRIWNTTTGEMEAEVWCYAVIVRSVAFSPDGSKVVAGLHDGAVQIWDVATRLIEAVLGGHTDPVLSVAFSRDGSRIISGSLDNTIRIWDAAMSDMEAQLWTFTHPIISVAFSQDSSQVVAGSKDGTIRIWNAMTGEMETTLQGHTGAVWSVEFSQDGGQVVSGSNDSTVRIWNTKTGKMAAKLLFHPFAVFSAAFSHDGSRVVGGSNGLTVRIWNVATGEMEAELDGHGSKVRSVSFSQDGNQVVSGADNSTIRIWNLAKGEMEAKLVGPPSSIRSIACSLDPSGISPPPEPPQLVSVSPDNDWLLGTHSDCRIPDHYRASGLFSLSGSKACFVHEECHLIILVML